MNSIYRKTVSGIQLIIVMMLVSSCVKKLPDADPDQVAFLVRLPSIAQAHFEAYCTSEDVFLDQVLVQSPSAQIETIDFSFYRFARDERFTFGNLDVEDGLWLITFIGNSALTNEEFRIVVPYDMNIIPDDTDE